MSVLSRQAGEDSAITVHLRGAVQPAVVVADRRSLPRTDATTTKVKLANRWAASYYARV
jgi:hypothetical protein